MKTLLSSDDIITARPFFFSFMSLLISLQCCDSELLHVRELHRRLAIRPAGGLEVQLSASQSHVPGAAAGTYTYYSL